MVELVSLTALPLIYDTKMTYDVASCRNRCKVPALYDDKRLTTTTTNEFVIVVLQGGGVGEELKGNSIAVSSMSLEPNAVIKARCGEMRCEATRLSVV